MNKWLFALPLVLFLGLAALLFGGLFNDPTVLPSVRVSQPLPAFSAPDLVTPDRLVTAADLRGPTLLNVWATWCPPCRVEHPFLVALAAQGVTIDGLNYKDRRSAALGWLDELGNPYRHLVEDARGQIGLDLGVYGAPETFFIDHQGVIRHRHAGPIDADLWRNQLQAQWQQLLADAAAPKTP